MVNGAQPPEPESSQQGEATALAPQWWGWGRWVLLGGAIALGLGGVGTVASWWFVRSQLTPWAQAALGEILQRPVTLGPVEAMTPFGVRFGPSAVPATESDGDRLTVEAIAVGFDPWQLLRRQLSPTITLQGLDLVVTQEADGQWLTLDLNLPEGDPTVEPWLKVATTVVIPDGTVQIQPYGFTPAAAGGAGTAPVAPPAPVVLEGVEVRAQVARIAPGETSPVAGVPLPAQRIQAQVSATLASGGRVRGQGDWLQPVGAGDLVGNLALSLQEIALAPLVGSGLGAVPGGVTLPGAVTAGTLGGSLEVAWALAQTPQVQGTLRLQGGEIALEALPQPVDNLGARLRIQGNQLRLEQGTARYGPVALRAEGQVDARQGYDLRATVDPFAIADLIPLLPTPVPTTLTGTVQASATVTGPLTAPQFQGTLTSTTPLTVDRVVLAGLEATGSYDWAGRVATLTGITLRPAGGGVVTAQGQFQGPWPTGNLTLALQGEDLPADLIGRAYGLPDTITLGPVGVTGTVAGSWPDLGGQVAWQAPGGTYPSRGVAQVRGDRVVIQAAIAQVGQGQVQGRGVLTRSQWQLDVTAQDIALGPFNPALQGEQINAQAQLSGDWQNLGLAGIRGVGQAQGSLGGGSLTSQFTVGGGAWTAQVQGRGLVVNRFVPGLTGNTASLVGPVQVSAQLSGPLVGFSLGRVQGRGSLATTVAGGAIAGQFSLAQGGWRVQGQGQGVNLPLLSDRLRGQADGRFQLAGRLAGFSPASLRGQAQVTLSQGLATVAQVNWPMSAQAPLRAQVAWDGQRLRIDEAQGAGIQVRGTVQPRFPRGQLPQLGAIDLALQVQDYPLANLPGPIPITLGGLGSFEGRLRGELPSLALVGTVAFQDLQVETLRFEPQLAGTVALSPQQGITVDVRGEQDQIQATVQPQPRQINFRVQAGTAIALGETEGDRLQARFYEFPLSLVRLPPTVTQFGDLRGQIRFASASINLAQGTGAGQFQLADLGLGYLSADNFLGSFAFTPEVAVLQNGTVQLVERSSRGEILAQRQYTVSARTGLGPGARFQGELATADGSVQDVLNFFKINTLADVTRGLRPPTSLVPNSPEAAATLLATNPVGSAEDSLLNQLRRLAEIEEVQFLEEQTARQQPLPPLSALQGRFQGSARIQGTLPDLDQGPQVALAFDFTGEDWRWGPNFRADQVVARGRFQDQQLTLEPIRLQSERVTGPASITATGQLNLRTDQVPPEQPLVVRLSNVPVDGLREPLSLPVAITGALGGEIQVAGAVNDPTLIGALAIAEGTLNERPVDEAAIRFDYTDAYLTLEGILSTLDTPDPILLSLATPYQPPFVSRTPRSPTLRAKLEVRDEGLAFVNLLTDRLQWQGGSGALVANVQGQWDGRSSLATLIQGLEVLDGALQFQDATVALQILPEAPLTAVAGAVRLEGLRSGAGGVNLREPALVVDGLRGNFSAGQLTAQGVIPLVAPLNLEGQTTGDRRPLTLALQDLNLNLAGLYSGQVGGTVVVGGSLVTGLEVGGQVNLQQGRVTIPEGAGDEGAAGAETQQAGFRLPPPQYRNLVVALGERIEVIQGNLINVTAEGSLQLNGTLTRPEPFGIIRLVGGRINLLTTALQLSGGDNRAEFRDSLDPLLRVTLATTVPDNSRREILFTPSPFPRNERPDINRNALTLGQEGIRTVRIQAELNTLASQLQTIQDFEDFQRVVRLSSSPPRSQTEIFTLLSSDVLTALGAVAGNTDSGGGQGGGQGGQGGGQGASAGGGQNLGNIAGVLAVSFLQNIIGGLLPLTDFRIFPVSPETSQVNDSFDIGAEIGTNLSPSLAVSVLRVITTESPFQFNVRYRISDQFSVRGITSTREFRERSGLLLEYETRF